MWPQTTSEAITFDQIKIQTCKATQNDRQNLIFVKDKHIHGKKMARKGRTKVIYKGTFVSEQSLNSTANSAHLAQLLR